jgi:hypothetical protein
MVRWDEISATAIGFESPPHIPSVSIEGVVKDAILDSLIKDRRRMALEIFPIDPAVMAAHGLLAEYRVDDASVHWRIPLIQVPGVVKTAARAAQAFQPDRWRGYFQRPWTGGVFRFRRQRIGPA